MKELSMRGDKSRRHQALYWARVVVIGSAIGTFSAGCTRIELQTKAEAYSDAIATSSNEMILLNAVRASQRAPMSFIGLGEVVASPSVSGGASGTFNFDPFGLTSYVLNPSVNVTGGFSTFTMSNLNRDKFMEGIRSPVSKKLIQDFVELKWPEELIELMLVASYNVRREELARIERDVALKCATQTDLRTRSICRIIEHGEEVYQQAGCFHYTESGPTVTILNTARDLCGMVKFQSFIRKQRLLHIHHKFTFRPRSAQGILYYLGELIAAQNYSTKLYTPEILVGAPETPEGRKLVPLFVVHRGAPVLGEAAVRVFYQGDAFYIPRPELGTSEEARSLQVLDFVSQVITAQTTSTDLPKSGTIGLVTLR